MERLAGILLEMQSLDPNLNRWGIGHVDDDFTFADDRRLVLADLVSLRQVRIEIVLPIEYRSQIDLCLEAEPSADCLPDAFFVDHWKHTGHRGIDQSNLRIRFAPERG